MEATAQTVTFTVNGIEITAYQIEGETQLRFTNRLIAEAIGMSKSSPQNFLQKQKDLSPPIKAMIPERNFPIPLSSEESAIAFWKYQAAKGNEIALQLVNALENRCLSEWLKGQPVEPKIVTETQRKVVTELHTPSPASIELPSPEELAQYKALLEIVSEYLAEAELDAVAIAQWKLTELGKKYPALTHLVQSAQQFLGLHDSLPATGYIPTQLAERVSEELEQPITASQVNHALHELGLQEFTKPNSRERRLTEAGKDYGRTLLATSKAGSWQGSRVIWFESVIPVLCDYFQHSAEIVQNGKASSY
ncbi:MAG: hypothetical protein ACLFQP_03030 [Halothece sp.]